MNLVTSTVLSDQSLCKSSWLQVEVTQTTTQTALQQSLSSILEKALETARQKNLAQISFLYPVSWKEIEATLLKNKWQKSLLTLQKECTPLKNKMSPPAACTTQPLPFTALQTVLTEQADYHSKAYPKYYASVASLDWQRYEKDITSDTHSPNALTLSWVENGIVLGTILGEIQNTSAHIYEFIVSKNARSKGIGSSLLQQFLQEANIKGSKKILVEAWWDQPSVNLYLRNGFMPEKQECYLQL